MQRLPAFVCMLCVTSSVVGTISDDAHISGFDIIDGLCLSPRTDRLVYRHKNRTHVYIGFDVLKTGVVDVFTWRIIDHTNGTFISTHVLHASRPALDFRREVTRQHIIGATGRRHEETFRRRLTRKMRDCRRKYRVAKEYCTIKAVIFVFARLRMRKVTFDRSCDFFVK